MHSSGFAPTAATALPNSQGVRLCGARACVLASHDEHTGTLYVYAR